MTDLSSDRAGLLALRAAVGGRIILWNLSQPTPCVWSGVTCESNRVTELRLPGVGLFGEIPANTVGNLTSLQTLSLRYNALSGQIPSDFANCVNLRHLYLQDNSFSGEIPSFLFSLRNLIRLNLAGNRFSGRIAPSFSNLNKLGTLYLESNRLTGSIPDLNLPVLQQFNVSYNQLRGAIPSRLGSQPASSFEGNSLCGRPLRSCPRKKLSTGAIAAIVIGSVLGFLLLLLLLIFLCRKWRPKKDSNVKQTKPETPNVKSMGIRNSATRIKGEAASASIGDKKMVFFRNAPRVYDLEELLRASAEVLGKGTFGTSYKAVLETGVVVAVKRLKDVTTSEKEFKEKIEMVGTMDHENLVPLRAYYYNKSEKLLIYDYMPMGSLSALMHGNRGEGSTPLNWETRSSLALGAARGIAYLHSNGPTISHGNIKSSNILLTGSYDARVSDFRLASLVGQTSMPNHRSGGYRAPEVTDPGKVSQKADVYSFGVLLLELLTGKAPTQAVLNDEGIDLPRWVQSVVQEEWTSEVFDPELLRYQETVEEEMVQLLQLAIDCVDQNPDRRPSMAEVTSRIDELCRSSLLQQDEEDGS